MLKHVFNVDAIIESLAHTERSAAVITLIDISVCEPLYVCVHTSVCVCVRVAVHNISHLITLNRTVCAINWVLLSYGFIQYSYSKREREKQQKTIYNDEIVQSRTSESE